MAKGLVNEPQCIIRTMSGFLNRLRRIVVVSWIGAVAGSLGVWVFAKYLEMLWWAVGGLLGALFGAFWDWMVGAGAARLPNKTTA